MDFAADFAPLGAVKVSDVDAYFSGRINATLQFGARLLSLAEAVCAWLGRGPQPLTWME
jgi:hypothetical protein